MPITVVALPFDTTCNSYVSSEDMETYVTDRVVDASQKATWAGLTDDQKASYLVNATRSLDSLFDWFGYKYSRDQKLKWPRADVYVEGYWVDNTTFPEPVVQATCELALFMAENEGATSVTSGGQFDSLAVGPLKIDFNEASPASLTGTKFFPDILPILLKDYGTVAMPDIPGASTLKQSRLVRA